MASRMHGTYDVDIKGDLKRCVFCGEYKELSNFAKNGFNTAGEQRYRDDCKTCYSIRRRENNSKKKHTDFIGSMKRRGEVAPELSFQEWKECLIFFQGACCYCGATPRKGQRLTKDHLEAVSKGGTTTQGNIVPACGCCNSSKGNKEWREWYMSQACFSQERMNKIFLWRSIMSQL